MPFHHHNIMVFFKHRNTAFYLAKLPIPKLLDLARPHIASIQLDAFQEPRGNFDFIFMTLMQAQYPIRNPN